MHEFSSFVTLTYDEAFLPPGGNLVPKHLQDFLKRLRKNLEPRQIRFFAVGEYGENTWRPHYHLAIFGLSVTESDIVKKSWRQGFVSLFELNKQTSRYISGYMVKGKTGKDNPALEGRHPEFMRCSRMNGGIGLPKIKLLAEKLSSFENLRKEPVSSLRRGKTRFALGRYLTQKVQEHAGIPKEIYQERFQQHQKVLYEVCSKLVNTTYYDAILEIDKDENNAIIHNTKNFTRRRTL